MTTIIVSGALANKHLSGGAIWTRLSWLLGFRRLASQVYFVEQLDCASVVDARGCPTSFAESENLARFTRTMQEFGIEGNAALLYEDGEEIYGMSRADLVELAKSTDVLVNITGNLRVDWICQWPARRVYLDLDPGFTQLWNHGGIGGFNLKGHDMYYTVGENIGTPACQIPTDGIDWRRTRQPVVLDEWPMTDAVSQHGFTTVGSWRGPYGALEWNGARLGIKAHEFRKFVELPERVASTFEIALDIQEADGKDLASLREHGWQIIDPQIATPDPAAFRRYVQASGSEFSAAQGIYVETGSGWFSDRTVRYLASGKPALVQDTGFSRNYPVGEGLISFQSLDEAIAGAKAIERDYDRHRLAARALAERYFDSDKVLGQMLDEIGISPS